MRVCGRREPSPSYRHSLVNRCGRQSSVQQVRRAPCTPASIMYALDTDKRRADLRGSDGWTRSTPGSAQRKNRCRACSGSFCRARRQDGLITAHDQSTETRSCSSVHRLATQFPQLHGGRRGSSPTQIGLSSSHDFFRVQVALEEVGLIRAFIMSPRRAVRSFASLRASLGALHHPSRLQHICAWDAIGVGFAAPLHIRAHR